MKRSIKVFTLLLGVMFFMSSCSDELSNLEENNFIEESVDGHAHHRSCGHFMYMNKLESDPVFKSAHEKKMEKFSNFLKTNVQERTVCGNPTLLPVAIHFQSVSNPDATCLAGLAQTSIAALNQDYQGSNTDISTWNNQASSYFPGITNGETCVEFQIANQNHPSGFGLNNGDLAVTVNQTTGDDIPQFTGYINIIVRPNTGLLGYAPLGGSGDGDALVVDAAAFGLGGSCGNVGAQAPFNLGRTLTHEMGHYLLLDHIWGNGCGVDDDVADTPNQAGENYDCPSFGASSCGSNDMFMNYMDYVNDACMYMFSAGQSSRMENFISSNLSNVVNNASNVIDSGAGSGGSGGGSGGGTGGGSGGGTGNTCESPTDGTATEITPTATKIVWTAVDNAQRYLISYKPAVGGVWKSKLSSSTARRLLALTPNTDYIFKMRVRCPGIGWQPYGPISTFTTLPAAGGGSGGSSTTVKMKIKLDDYGSETTWELVDDSNGLVIENGGPYQDGNNGQIINKTWSLDDGDYTYYIDDSYGDGICCDYGNGWAKILNASNQVIAQSDGNFGSYDVLFFTVDNGVVSFKSEEKDQKSAFVVKKEVIHDF